MARNAVGGAGLFKVTRSIDGRLRPTQRKCPNIEILAKTRAQRRRLGKVETAGSVVPAFGAQERHVGPAFLREAVGELEHVGDEEHARAIVEQGGDDLPGDLRAFAFVGRSEGFVERRIPQTFARASGPWQRSVLTSN
jgi:hypothetical protein